MTPTLTSMHEVDGPDDGRLSRRDVLRTAGLFVLVGGGLGAALAACANDEPDTTPVAQPAQGTQATMYRQEGCSCCVTHADYLRENGFAVDLKTVDDLQPIRERYGVPEAGVGCHTAVIDGYVVEGHVPVEAIERMLSERPRIDGIAVVGMPTNSPGMGEPNGEPLQVLSIRDGHVADYMSLTTF